MVPVQGRAIAHTGRSQPVNRPLMIWSETGNNSVIKSGPVITECVQLFLPVNMEIPAGYEIFFFVNYPGRYGHGWG